jgi:hypothetical protein
MQVLVCPTMLHFMILFICTVEHKMIISVLIGVAVIGAIMHFQRIDGEWL